MIRKFFIGFFLGLTLVANANNRSAELARLDSVLARQPYYLKVREQHIEQLKIQLQHEQRVQQRELFSRPIYLQLNGNLHH